jgi:RecA/RadA recombinase
MTEHSHKEVLKLSLSLDSIEFQETPIFNLEPYPLDAVLGKVIIAKTISVLHGPEQAPLSRLAHAVAVAGAQEGISIYLDAGMLFDSFLLNNLTDDRSVKSRIYHRNLENLEQLEQAALQIPSMSEVKVVVLDSLYNLLNSSGEPGSRERLRSLCHALDVLRRMVNAGNMHMLLTDTSAESRGTNEVKPVGGNVLAHATDTVVHVQKIQLDEHVRVLVERTPVMPPPGSVLVKITAKGIKSIKGGG